MKRKICLLISLTLVLLCVSSCTPSVSTETLAVLAEMYRAETPETLSTQRNKTKYPVYSLSEHVYKDEEAIYPEQKVYSKAKKEVIEKAYREFALVHPGILRYPKESLREYCKTDDYFEKVCFYVYIGEVAVRSYEWYHYLDTGVREFEFDGCNYYYSSSARLTESNVHDLRVMLAEQIQEKIDYYKLEQNENLVDEIRIWFDTNEEYLYAETEYIANATDETTASLGCFDHEHLFARVYIVN